MLDWSLIQSFVAVAENGSLSAAARSIGSSQPTLSRHISSLEEAVGTRLFERAKAGVTLTDAGLELMQHASQMANAASGLSYFGEDTKSHLSGMVRITASEIVASYILPDILAAFHIEEPDIQLELIASDETSNLLRREADIAIRMFRPTQLDVISRKIGEFKLGVYAAHSYIERREMPENLMDIVDHEVIGYDRSTLIIDGFGKMGLEVKRDFFAFRCDNQIVCWKMVVAGFGIGFNQTKIGDAEPKVVRIPTPMDVGSMPIWLTAHQNLKSSARVRRVYDFLAEALSKAVD